MSIPAVFALIYVPNKLIVDGNATATANNIAASETLFRLGIAGELISQAGFILVALALYDLLKAVNQRHASLMVILIVVSIPGPLQFGELVFILGLLVMGPNPKPLAESSV